MKRSDWDDFDYQEQEDRTSYGNKKNAKPRKRRWREIETIKEKQRLRRELSDIYQYSC